MGAGHPLVSAPAGRRGVVLLDRTRALLTGRGPRVLVPERLPPNDGGISYGQAAVAAGRMAR